MEPGLSALRPFLQRTCYRGFLDCETGLPKSITHVSTEREEYKEVSNTSRGGEMSQGS